MMSQRFYMSVLLVVPFFHKAIGVEQWKLHQLCGTNLKAFGGILEFDAQKLSANECRLTITGRGPNNTQLAVFFTIFTASEDCDGNITLNEPRPNYNSDIPGLLESFCNNDPWVGNTEYSTQSNVLEIKYTKRSNSKRVFNFTMVVTSFTQRLMGCTMDEKINQDMVTCRSKRCVHKSLLCADLNPCGDNSDCTNSTEELLAVERSRVNYVSAIIVIVVVVFALFAVIQVYLIMRNRHVKCSCRKNGSQIRYQNEDQRLALEL